jgi:3-hydroxyisobutyrate dehydrogenase
MLAGDHEREVAFTPALRAKDVGYALRLASELGIGSPFGALAARTYQQLSAAYPGEVNESAVIELARNPRS